MSCRNYNALLLYHFYDGCGNISRVPIIDGPNLFFGSDRLVKAYF